MRNTQFFQIQDKVQQLLGILTYFDLIAPVNADFLTTGNTFNSPVIFLEKWESLKIVLDARQLNTTIDETKSSWSIDSIQYKSARIKGPVFSKADMYSAYNQTLLDRASEKIKNFVIAGQQYCFKRLFYGISISAAAFLSFLGSIFTLLVLQKKITAYLGDLFIQDATTDKML